MLERSRQAMGVTKTNTPRQPWVTEVLLRNVMHKVNLYKRCRLGPGYCALKARYDKYKKNVLKDILRKVNVAYYEEQVSAVNGNTQKLWNVVNMTLNKKYKGTWADAMRDSQDDIITSSSQIAEDLNDYFAEIVNRVGRLAAAIRPLYLLPP